MELKQRKISELIRADYNPRKITSKELDELKESIVKFGITEPVIVNMHNKRKNIIISGHQRLKIVEELEWETAPCLELNLTLEDEKELNVRMNKNGGKFDKSLLNEFFEKDELISYGFTDEELSDITNVEETMKELQVEEPIYPIVPVMSEKYDYVIILATNEIDNAFMNSFFDIETQKSYKNSKVGVGKVVLFEKFKKIIDERNS